MQATHRRFVITNNVTNQNQFRGLKLQLARFQLTKVHKCVHLLSRHQKYIKRETPIIICETCYIHSTHQVVTINRSNTHRQQWKKRIMCLETLYLQYSFFKICSCLRSIYSNLCLYELVTTVLGVVHERFLRCGFKYLHLNCR